MKLFWLTVIVVIGFACVEAKRKRKFEGDFEFVDEDEPRTLKNSEKKRWIHDPNNERCHALNCKKKELCLFEDEFTAVCVSKKEIHKNGDIIVPKAKVVAEEEARRRANNEDDDDDLDDDDVFYDTEEDSDDQDDDLNESMTCKPCPVVKPTFLCGSDNRTYSSLCRMDYHNCIHHTTIRVNCKGFCPCKDTDLHLRKKQRQTERLNNFMNKYKATLDKNNAIKSNNAIPRPDKDRYTLQPEDFKYENKHYKYIKYTKYNKEYNKLNGATYADDKERYNAYNDMLYRKNMVNSIDSGIPATTVCPPASLQAMGNRLLDWFSVIMADTKRRRSHAKVKVSHFPTSCKGEVKWMFQHLDVDLDSRLSVKELFDLEHDKNEQCIKPFLEQCDMDHDTWITPKEWCKCFDKADRPCAAVKRRIVGDLEGAYIPDCDGQGYYKSIQCHSAIGMCWCVDKHGVEFANTRTRGKPRCENLIDKSNVAQPNKNNKAAIDDEDDGDDAEQDLEGSADQTLDF